MSVFTCPYAVVEEAQWEANQTGREVFIVDHGEYMTIERFHSGPYIECVYPSD